VADRFRNFRFVESAPFYARSVEIAAHHDHTLLQPLGTANAFGVFQDLYTRSHAASASNVSWIGSVQVFFLIFSGLPAGKLLDAGHFRKLMLGASALYLLSCVILLPDMLSALTLAYQCFSSLSGEPKQVLSAYSAARCRVWSRLRVALPTCDRSAGTPLA
jgi:MFS family permease